ncbi:MAG: CapA family protein [Chloroflexi bacterium]|nr:CapA family protein [Chloroflexota bacterium]
MATSAPFVVAPTATTTATRAATMLPATATPRAAAPTVAGRAQLVFVGDVMLGRGVAPVRRALGNGYPLAQVAPFMRGSDLAFANLESPLTRQSFFRGGYNLRAEPAAVESLSLAGFDWVSVANNHSGDHGRAGLSDTLATLRGRGIAWAGGGDDEAQARKPAVKLVNGLRIALLAYDGLHATIEASGNLAGSQWLTLPRAAADIKQARAAGADIVIVAVHWGVEYQAGASAEQKRSARALAAAGADLIIGSHPHVVEPLEWLAQPDGRTALAAYSLGNFLFDQQFSTAVQEGVILRVVVDKQGVAALNLVPTRNRNGQIAVQTPAAAADELRRLLPAGALPAAWQRSATADSDGRTWWRRP